MLTRERVLLHIIHRSRSQMTRLRLTKYAFLLAQQTDLASRCYFYEFMPYRLGPFSHTLYRDLDRLNKAGYLLFPTPQTLALNENADIPSIEKNLSRAISLVLQEYDRYCLQELLKSVYSDFPWYTAQSLRPESRAVTVTTASLAVYTIGYQNTQVDGLLNYLMSLGIKVIVDVRRNAFSRRYGYSGRTLSRICGKVDFEYHHVPDLGIPPVWRRDLPCPSDYKDLFRRYRREIMPHVESQVREVSLVTTVKPTVLLCYEADPRCCHRSILAASVAKNTGLPVVNLRCGIEREASKNPSANNGQDLSSSITGIQGTGLHRGYH